MNGQARPFTIAEDGVYEAPDGSRFQFRKGHELGPNGADLKRVGDFEEPMGSVDYEAERRMMARYSVDRAEEWQRDGFRLLP